MLSKDDQSVYECLEWIQENGWNVLDEKNICKRFYFWEKIMGVGVLILIILFLGWTFDVEWENGCLYKTTHGKVIQF